VNEDVLIKVIVPVSMFAIMFSMGLTLTRKDFQRIFIFPKAIFIGLIVQLLVSPALGFMLAYAFDLPVMMAVGLVAVAACPGGSTSNVIAHIGKGDTALSITLTATATLATLFTLPIWINFALIFFGKGDTSIEMPILSTAIQLGLFTVLPIAIGMLARNTHPAWLKKEPIITKVAVTTMLAAFALIMLLDQNNTIGQAQQVLIPTILFVVFVAVLGFLIPKLSGLSAKSSATIAVEICLKNLLLSLFLASNSLNSLDAVLPTTVALASTMPMAIIIMVMFGIFNKRNHQAAVIS